MLNNTRQFEKIIFHSYNFPHEKKNSPAEISTCTFFFSEERKRQKPLLKGASRERWGC